MIKKRFHAYFRGSVQGVGFRFTARNIASALKIQGWARNLSDGGVEMVVQGQEENVKSFLERLREHFGSYIRDVDIDWQEPNEDLNDFSIKF